MRESTRSESVAHPNIEALSLAGLAVGMGSCFCLASDVIGDQGVRAAKRRTHLGVQVLIDLLGTAETGKDVFKIRFYPGNRVKSVSLEHIRHVLLTDNYVAVRGCESKTAPVFKIGGLGAVGFVLEDLFVKMEVDSARWHVVDDLLEPLLAEGSECIEGHGVLAQNVIDRVQDIYRTHRIEPVLPHLLWDCLLAFEEGSQVGSEVLAIGCVFGRGRVDSKKTASRKQGSLHILFDSCKCALKWWYGEGVRMPSPNDLHVGGRDLREMP